jgi:ABC-type uncharacterized transport system permease subunit
MRQLLAPILGSIMYQLVAAFIISLGLAPTDLKVNDGCVSIKHHRHSART